MQLTLQKKRQRADLLTLAAVAALFLVLAALLYGGLLNRQMTNMLVPTAVYIVMAVSLNLVVGLLGELSLGHAGFMSVGLFSGCLVSIALSSSPLPLGLRLPLSMLAGGLVAAVFGLLVGLPVLRLRGDYLAIVTLAFGEFIKDLLNCLLVGYDSRGLHFAFNFNGKQNVDSLNLAEDGIAIIKGAQGAAGTTKLATFTAGFILVILALVVVLNLMRSRSGRAIMALRDNRIAAESVGINVTKYKLMALVTSAALAGAAGALFGLNYSSLQATKFNFDTSILVLVFVVLGGLGNMRGSIIAATVLTILPEALREFADYRMLVYAIVLILVMLATNSPKLKAMLNRAFSPIKRLFAGKGAEKEAAQ